MQFEITDIIKSLIKKPNHFFFCCSFFLILSSINDAQSQSQFNYCGEADLLVKALTKYHYAPLQLNDQWSNNIFNKFINLLDPYGLYFTLADIQTLDPYRYTLKSAIADPSCTFLKTVTKLYEQRLNYADTQISIILQKPIDYFLKDTITFSLNAKTSYCPENRKLEKRWLKWLKYQILLQLFYPGNENNDPFSFEPRQILEKEQEAVKKVNIREKRRINHILQNYMGFENYVSSVFYNSIALSYDPHSSYFSFNEKQNFLSSISKESYSFGIGLTENLNGEIQIDNLVPGGSAWKSGKLNKGDVLIQLTWEDKKPVNLANLSIEEVGEIIKSSYTGTLEFKVRKTSGQLISIKLTKQKISVEENIITSHILKGEKKIGYVPLPDFYTETENQNALGCANDIAKEIIKLKKENIDGLILDLRYNGGGSVAEAIDLAGIFIDEGPLGIVRYRNGKPVILKDMNRGTVYDGPLLILVNGQSASASEIFAAVLQDYQRAVIAGSTTYGKATGQNIFPLDSTESEDGSNYRKSNSGSGYAKITDCKFYRITGSSYQQKGVEPDVKLPNTLEEIEYSEKSNPAALISDSIIKKLNYNLLPVLPINELNKKSSERIKVNQRFQKIASLNLSFAADLKQGKTINLQIDSFKKEEKEIYSYFQAIDTLPKLVSKNYNVVNNNYNEQIIKVDAERRKFDEQLTKNLQEDIYIDEAYRILNDLINFTKLKK